MTDKIFDKYGNELWCERGKVHLRLNGSGRVRFLGTVEGDVFRTFRKDSHRFRVMDGIGFNWHLMKYGKFRNVVVHTEEGEELRTTRKWILRHGRACLPGGRRYELQLFLKISDFAGFVEPEPSASGGRTRAREPVQLPLFA